MNDNETNYVDKLFSSSSGETNEAEVGFPLLEMPEELTNKLYNITEASSVTALSTKQTLLNRWPVFTGIAATVLVAVMGTQFYLQQQTLKQLQQAQADLVTALHYLNEANRLTQAQVLNSLNTNINKKSIKPAVEISRDLLIPNLQKPNPDHELKKSSHTL